MNFFTHPLFVCDVPALLNLVSMFWSRYEGLPVGFHTRCHKHHHGPEESVQILWGRTSSSLHSEDLYVTLPDEILEDKYLRTGGRWPSVLVIACPHG